MKTHKIPSEHNKTYFFSCEGGQTLEQVVQRASGVSVLGDPWTTCLRRDIAFSDLRRSLQRFRDQNPSRIFVRFPLPPQFHSL